MSRAYRRNSPARPHWGTARSCHSLCAGERRPARFACVFARAEPGSIPEMPFASYGPTRASSRHDCGRRSAPNARRRLLPDGRLDERLGSHRSVSHPRDGSCRAGSHLCERLTATDLLTPVRTGPSRREAATKRLRISRRLPGSRKRRQPLGLRRLSRLAGRHRPDGGMSRR